ncbi:MAG TPA: hypothetical protein DCM28_08585 [Phycisphaerales bacterium]|nr:hypothetical protein [Phycisphaerales bacterium]HCD34956.1 hypothetical protein [Phycisphaerales bacterium]
MAVPPTPSPITLQKLPAKPDLNQLKKQAKELLRDFKAHEPDALTLVTRFFTPPEDDSLTLSQAQLTLARSYGFESWPKLKAFVDGVTTQRLFKAVMAGEHATVKNMLDRRPELVNASGDGTGNGERQLIHWAILNDDPRMLQILMDAGADAHKGIWPHRESTDAYTLAKERGLDHLVNIIDDSEMQRRESMSCPNITISPTLDQLNTLITDGKNDDAIAMLEAQPDLIKQCNREGGSPLHVACSVANEQMVDWLCAHRADARKVDIKGYTPMDHAVLATDWKHAHRIEASLSIMDRLMVRGCEVTAMGAAAMGDCERLKQLHKQSPGCLKGGHHWYWGWGGYLSVAVIFDRKDVLECLLDLGLDIDEPILLDTEEDEAWSWGGPLWRAAAMGRHELAAYLLKRGANPNANVYASGWPLDRAYERGDQKMVDMLYQAGAKPEAWTLCAAFDVEGVQRILDEKEHTPDYLRELVWSAACCTCLPIVKLVLPQLKLAADDTHWHDLLSQPLRCGVPSEAVKPADYNDDDRFEIMRLMLDAGGDPNARGRFGLTLLHFVAARDGFAAWSLMGEKNRNRFATMLLDAGADPSLRDELLGSTAMGWACRYGRKDLVQLLIERGVPVVEPDALGWATPMAWAQKMGHVSIVKLLENAM